MKSILDNVTLWELVIPGTHDSGSFNLTTEMVPGYVSDFLEDLIKVADALHIPIEEIIKIWAKSQSGSFY